MLVYRGRIQRMPSNVYDSIHEWYMLPWWVKGKKIMEKVAKAKESASMSLWPVTTII